MFIIMEKPVFDVDLASNIHAAGVVAVVILEQEEDGVPLARALIEGGVRVMELTLRTGSALHALESIRRDVPELIAGVGTILTVAQVAQVKDAGAAFGVAPGTNRRVIEAAKDAGLSFAPGVATPSDIEAALECGCTLLKFFPCEGSGGLPFLRTMAAPYLHCGLRFIPLGGIHAANMESYLADPLILAVGGSWLAPQEAIRAEDWGAITTLASAAAEKVASMRSARTKR
jgi:2-dehydro-3-deoxyphosphogluconate aldolase/(4S)-4-hydroxy-2-oxoglutarate aldolase